MIIELDEGEHEWELEWQSWLESMESHIEFKGEETMADSLSRIYEGDDNAKIWLCSEI